MGALSMQTSFIINKRKVAEKSRSHDSRRFYNSLSPKKRRGRNIKASQSPKWSVCKKKSLPLTSFNFQIPFNFRYRFPIGTNEEILKWTFFYYFSFNLISTSLTFSVKCRARWRTGVHNYQRLNLAGSFSWLGCGWKKKMQTYTMERGSLL